MRTKGAAEKKRDLQEEVVRACPVSCEILATDVTAAAPNATPIP